MPKVAACVDNYSNVHVEDPSAMRVAWELSGPLANLARLLISEAWRAKAETPNFLLNADNHFNEFVARFHEEECRDEAQHTSYQLNQ